MNAVTQIYPLAHALHVAAVVLWVGGMALAAAAAPGSGPATASALRRAFRWLVTPAMLAALALGLWLATSGGWMRSGWLMWKLPLVLLLAGLHGVLAGRLRRLAAGEAGAMGRAWAARLPAVVVVVALAVIAWLAVTKPGAG